MNKTETELSDGEKLARLRLIRTEGIGPVTFRGLLARFGNAQTALDGVVDLAARRGRKKPLSLARKDHCLAELERTAANGAIALFLGQPPYPIHLAALEDAPPVLYAKGRLDLMATGAVGIVGARNASASGLKIARTLASALADAGVTVVSGLARGIDTAAHQASLEKGTIACVAGGLDISYPSENAALQDAIKESGLLISEMAPGTEPQARHFPRRNRLISGLSDGVLVIEAAQRSGSLITARFALEQGRDVFAVPGSPLDPRAQGGNQLIKDGAILVQGPDDILSELRPFDPAEKSANAIKVTPEAVTPPPVSRDVQKSAVGSFNLEELLSDTPVHVDELIRLSGAPTQVVQASLLELELAGKIMRHSGGRLSRNYTE